MNTKVFRVVQIIHSILLIATLFHCFFFSPTHAQHSFRNIGQVPHSGAAATSVGDIALFGGGGDCPNNCFFSTPTNEVRIYNATARSWTNSQLSRPVMNHAAATAGNLALFAGGSNDSLGLYSYNVVDIYDPTTATWSTATLSVARSLLVGASLGNLALFAGGISMVDNTPVYSNVVDIFDSNTGEWSTTTLSTPERYKSTFDGNYAVFTRVYAADVLEIFNKNQDSWTSVNVPEVRRTAALTMAANRIFVAGGAVGETASRRVDIYDLIQETWSTATLSIPRYLATAFAVNDSMVFFIGGFNNTESISANNRPQFNIDVYDTISDTWRVFSSEGRFAPTPVASVGNLLIVGRGTPPSRRVDLYGVCSNMADCDDGQFCTGVELCNDLLCGATSGDPCSDGDFCNNTCNEDAKTCHTPFNTSCDDEVFCNGYDYCDEGVCVSAGDPCADGPVCNTYCNETAQNCLQPFNASCDDHVFCNGYDYCDNGVCIHTGDPCTEYTVCQRRCDAQGICNFDLLNTPCIENGTMIPGKCLSGTCVPDPTTGATTATPATSEPATTSVTSTTSTTSVVTTLSGTTGSQKSEEPPGNVESEGDDNTILWAVVGAVGGLLVCSLLVLAIVCLVRRKRTEQSDEPGDVELDAAPNDTGEFTIVKRLGSGNFGDVYLGKWKSTNVAMKQIKLSHTSIEEFEREFAVLSKLRHPHIVSFLKLHVDKDKNKYLVFEYISKGSLLDVLHSKQGKLTAHQKQKMACDIAKGMEYLEDSKIVHRDLSARNCLVSKVDGEYCIKVSDFGLARITSTGYYKVETSKIPVKWSAPEVFSGLATSKSDVWSFGIVFWEIWTEGQEPYKWLSSKEATTAIPKGEQPPRPSNCPDAAWEVMQSCWALNPSERPSFSELTKKLSELVEDEQSSTSASDDDDEEGAQSQIAYQTTPAFVNEH